MPRITHGDKHPAGRRGVVHAVEEVFDVELNLELLPFDVGVVGGKGVGHGVRRQVEIVEGVARTFTDIARPASDPQFVTTHDAAKVINRRQRSAVFGHVLQAHALISRVFGDLGIGVGVAANQAPLLAQLAADIQF